MCLQILLKRIQSCYKALIFNGPFPNPILNFGVRAFLNRKILGEPKEKNYGKSSPSKVTVINFHQLSLLILRLAFRARNLIGTRTLEFILS